MSLQLQILPDEFVVMRFRGPVEGLSSLLNSVSESLFSVTRTPEEISVVCNSGHSFDAESLTELLCEKEANWRAIKVIGPLDFSMVGVLAGLATSLANAGVSLFCLSTFLTDYILVKDQDLTVAVQSLQESGYEIL